MSIIVIQSGVSSSSSNTTTSAQNIIDSVSRDMRSLLGNTGTDADIILDYVNRVHLDILRQTRWQFLLSSKQYFVTIAGVTDYWIGDTTGAQVGTHNTGLNLTDVDYLNEESVYDRSNYNQLDRTRDYPLGSAFSYPDFTPRQGRPAQWRQPYGTPSVISLYPAPDNQNTYQPVPPPPDTDTSVSGALTARYYYIRTAYNDSRGNLGAASGYLGGTSAVQYVAANNVLLVRSPRPIATQASSDVLYNTYNVYVGTAQGRETLQASNITIGTDWTEPNTGLVAGAAFPTVNNLEPIQGYEIEFEYYKKRQQITTVGQILQVPDYYKDIVIAGVNYYVCKFLLKSPPEAMEWLQIYKEGIVDIIRDKNLGTFRSDFIRPDPTS